jgi:hypothetical protein
LEQRCLFAVSGAPRPEGLVGYWAFNAADVSDTTVRDRSGKNRNGTLVGGPTLAPGRHAEAVSLDGVDDQVLVGNLMATGAGRISAAAWVYKNDADGDDFVVSKAAATSTTDPNYVWSLGVAGDLVRVRLQGAAGVETFDGPKIAAQRWTHLGFTYDGSNVRIYVNGRLRQTAAHTGLVLASNVPVVIGGSADGLNDTNFAGRIDDVRLYDLALDPRSMLAAYYRAPSLAAPPTRGGYGGAATPVPGLIQAESYDLGGEGVAYHDTTAANEGGMYRTTEAPDVADGALNDDATYAVGWTRPGEWLQYTVNVTQTASYALDARVSSSVGTAQFRVDVDGADATGTIAVPNTGGFNAWTTVQRPGVGLTAGTHVLRVYVVAGGFNLNYLQLSVEAELTAPAAPASLAASANLPSQIGLSWADNSTNESGFKIEQSTDGVDFTQIATVGANVTRYTATRLAASTPYTFRVRAFNAAGDSDYSEPVSATTQDQTAAVMPDATNTGLAVAGIAESSLRVISGIYTAKADEVLEGINFTGGVVIPAGADNVVIRNCLVSGGGYGVQSMDGAMNLLVENTEVRGCSGKGMLIHHATVRRVYIHDVGSDGMFVHTGGDLLVEYCFITRCGKDNPTDHTDGIQVHNAGSNIVIRYNHISLPASFYNSGSNSTWGLLNSCIVFQSDWGAIADSSIIGNWLDGGGYTVRLEEKEGYQITGITVADNRFSRDYDYGPRGIIDTPGYTWTDNVYDDNGQVIP